ncbi:esterase family protein [Corynebacterium phoceense]|uniref:alpha/beta hydrolase n=1 Tax=Corynebacterium phoceense TaxID=1686286 RepID=UPI00211BBDE6|nr:alpha/beta hydrolase family protein [Corynebacterium phoceense]MCQ9333710.1 esterase family protein [Corynebacterium phoceense]
MRLSLSRVAATALTATTLAATAFVTGLAAPAQADPLAPGSSLPGTAASQPWLGNTPFIVSKKHVDDNHWKVRMWSPANRAVVDNNVLLPSGDQPRPSFYLLPGLKGGQAGLNWMSHSDVKSWFANKHVNVVMPLGGPYSLYTDWDSADPILGVNKWNTYMTQKLPPLIDKEFHGTGRDAIGGLSSTGAAALDIAGHAPRRFVAAASYSGCPIRSGAYGGTISTAMIALGGGSSFNAWGLPGNASSREHDPYANLDRLRGVKVFVASASGQPGGPDGISNLSSTAGQAFGPAEVEIVANACTQQFTDNARRAELDVNRYYTPQGSHSFGLFSHQMKVSWAQTIARTIGAANL